MSADEPAPAEYEGKLKQVDRELELDFIREFSAGGELLRGLSVDDRRERIPLCQCEVRHLRTL
jgi:hypothetical protein